MRVIAAESATAMSCAAADWIGTVLAVKPDAVLALPTGRTPLGLYAELVRRSRAQRCSLETAKIFDLDEFLGLGAEDPHSYAAFMRGHLIEPLQLASERVRLLNGAAPDPAAECRAYDTAIEAAGGLDLCILGLGMNGHVAFNEPGASWDLRTHRVELSPETRAAQQPTPGGAAEEAWVCPTYGLTLGIRTLLEARRVLLLIAGDNKQAARSALGRGVADRAWPVTCLATHPNLTLIELS